MRLMQIIAAPLALLCTMAATSTLASASSEYSGNFPAPATINGERAGVGFGAGGPWAEPSDTMTSAIYGAVDFTVQGWDGSAWVTLGTVIGNNLVKRAGSFPARSTDRIRSTSPTHFQGGRARSRSKPGARHEA